MIKNHIKDLIQHAANEIGGEISAVTLTPRANEQFGDYSSNVAMQLSKKLKKNPVEIAELIKSKISLTSDIEKIEVVKPGFINFYLTEDFLMREAEDFHQKPAFPEFHFGSTGKVMIEFAHPNTHKLFHIGHLRNITTGESICRILTATGNKIIRANYQGDVGLHIAKCIWKIRNMISENDKNIFADKSITEKIKILGEAYAAGNAAYESDEKAKAEIVDIDRKIYTQDGEIQALWKETRQWSLDYFNDIYKRVYTKFDRLFFESETAARAVEIIAAAVEKGILEKSDGAIIFDGKPYGLDTRVFLNAIGIPTYEGKELALAEKEFTEFGTIDKLIHVLGGEQSSFSSVTFKVQQLINPELYGDKQYHLVYGWVRLKHGKMSSRTGNVVQGVWLLDEAKKQIIEKFNCDEETAETLAVGAIKYSFLKNGTQNETVFDFDESISLEGNSAPYLNYTYVRTQSLLKKAGHGGKTTKTVLSPEEKALLRHFHVFPHAVHSAAQSYSPNTIAHYLFELAQKYNLFYQKHKINNAQGDQRELRLFLTRHSGFLIKTGLELLGIKTVEKM